MKRVWASLVEYKYTKKNIFHISLKKEKLERCTNDFFFLYIII